MAYLYPNPIDSLLRLQKALDSYRSADWFGPSTSSGGAYPPVNIFQQDDNLVVIAELPGCNKDDIQVEVTGKRLRISGKKSIDYPEDASLHRRERIEGSFDRTITFPVELNADGVKAEYQNGVLALFLPRAEKDKPKSIAIN